MIWNDAGSGATYDVSFWQPDFGGGYASFGHITHASHSKPGANRFFTARSSNSIKTAIGFKQIWKDTGSGAKLDGAIWWPLCASGFVALGMVATRGYRPPPKTSVYCVAKKYTRRSSLSNQIWKDSGSGADADLGIWAIKDSPYFYGVASHSKPVAEVYTLDLSDDPGPEPGPSGNHRFNIVFDYRFANDYFDDPVKRRTLEAAARVWSNLITSDFETVPAGRVLKVTHPQTDKVYNVTLTEPIDDLLIFVFAFEFENRGTKAYAGPFARWSSGDKFDKRYNQKPFQPWVGKLSVNTAPRSPWFFDQTPETDHDIPSYTHYDFYSTAMHEMGHILGFLTSIYKDTGNYGDDEFTGANAMRYNNNKPVILEEDSSHISRYTTTGLARPAIDEYIMTGPSPIQGFRHYPAMLDMMMLKDIGYQVNLKALEKLPVQKYSVHPQSDFLMQKFSRTKAPTSYYQFTSTQEFYSPVTGYPPLYMPPAKDFLTNRLRAVDGGLRVPRGAGIIIDHGLKPNGNGNDVNIYSLVLDIRLPRAGVEYSLYNTNGQNSNAADAYISPRGTLGQGNYSDFKFKANQWYRVILTVNNKTGKRKYYVDGDLVLTQGGVETDGRFALYSGPGNDSFFRLFSSSILAETADIDVKKTLLFDYELNADEASALRGAGSIPSLL